MDFVEILKRGVFKSEPFPHWIVENVLSSNTLELITDSYPDSFSIHKRLKKSDLDESRYDQNTAYSLEFEMLNENELTLKNFAAAWIEQKDKILDYISAFLPPELSGQLDLVKKSSFSRGDFRASSPVKISGTTQLGPHLDSPFEILAGLIYLRIEGDNSDGGDLEIFSLKEDAPKNYMSIKRRVPLKYLNYLRTVKYESNKGVFFISHPYAIHGISTRELTQFDRRVINLSIELPESGDLKLFSQESLVDFSLTRNSKLKLIRIFKNKTRSFFKTKQNSRYGKYNWIKNDEI